MKFSVEINLNTLYIFHMLSVSKCTYDNEYGDKYKSFHSKEDLDYLKEHENLLFDINSKQSGLLSFLIILPATSSRDLKTIYQDFIRIFTGHANKVEIINQYPKNTLKYLGYKKEIKVISDILLRNYDIYVEKIYPTVVDEISNYISTLTQELENDSDFIDRAMKLTGLRYPYEKFEVLISNAINDGPQGVDISSYQDVFGTMDIKEEAYLIKHEFLVYLFKNSFLKSKKYPVQKYYLNVEALAEFYLELLGVKNLLPFHGCEKIIEKYRELYKENNKLKPEELLLKAYR